MIGPHDDTGASGHPASPPPGWYPDPSGVPAWRRWEGTTWGDATLPYGPPGPDPTSVTKERMTWPLLRAITPWALAAQAAGALVFASESPAYEGLRHWLRAYLNAESHNRPLPSVPANAIGPTSAAANLVHYAVLVATVVWVVAWLRYSAASMRVAAAARYPQRHRATSTGVLFFVPVIGPWIALAASRDSLPNGHEAREPLAVGWSAVAVGELLLIGLYVTVFSTPSQLAAWFVAGTCALVWLVAAVELPIGLQSIADDHATLGVRSRPSPS